MPIDLDAIKSRVNLVDLFSARGLKLIRRGANFATLCPFHKDSRPSLVINPHRQLWNCFGCSAAGDAITFVERFDNVSFKEAVERLGQQPALDASSFDAQDQEPAAMDTPASGRNNTPRLLERVVAYYERTLTTSSLAQDYLRSRGLTDSTILSQLRAGFSDGTLAKLLEKQPAHAAELTRRHVINKRGNEFFNGCLVFPILDSAGRIVNLYGRNTRAGSDIPHLYLPGPRRGVFNYPAIKGSVRSVILTESIFDTLALLTLGFANTTCSWGTKGFTADLLAALQRHNIRTVFVAYDADPAGDLGAEQLAERLGSHGITTRRVDLPTKDPNEFLVAGHSRDEFARLLEQARDLTPDDDRARLAPGRLLPMPPAVEPVSAAMDPPPPAQAVSPPPQDESVPPMELTPPATPALMVMPPAQTAPAPLEASVAMEPPTPLPPNSLVTRFGPRTYRVTLPRSSSQGFRVTLRLEADGKVLLDRFDLASDRARSAFVSKARKALPAFEQDLIEEDLFHLIDQLEERQLKKEEPSTPLSPKSSPMSQAEHTVALAFLESPTLMDDLLADLSAAGLVGEKTNKLLLYLIATSRLLEKPLSAVILSGSSSGKSYLIKIVADLMPPEAVFRYTRISAQALFYKEREALKHKLVVIEEAEGASDADYPLRVMQSDRSLTNLVTIKDPVTGLMTTQETEVEGPISLLVSSTAAAIHYENATRSFELAVDETSAQTAVILSAQRDARTAAGLGARKRLDAVRSRHHNAQRLLEPILVVNDYAPLLSFPTSPLRIRREHDKYLSLIEAITFLHQHQREKASLLVEGESEPTAYIKTTKLDLQLANRLFASVFVDTVGELSRQSRLLLGHLQELLAKKRKAPEARVTPPDGDSEALFEPGGLARREIREALDWSDYQLRICLQQLEDLEYVVATNGRQGKRYVYALTPKGQLAAGADPDELARQLGLTDPNTLPDELP
jgi:DNA primase catalytic core